MTDRQQRRLVNRDWQRQQFLKGLCRCGLALDGTSKYHCKVCHEAHIRMNHTRYHRRRDLGLCSTCGEPAERSRSNCVICTEKRNTLARGRYEQRKAAA